MRKFKFLLGVILAAALCVSYVGAQASRTEARRATPSKAGANNPQPASVQMDPEQIRAHVKFLASDLLEGRGTGQRGGDIAAEYIAAQFALYGLKPVGDDGTYFQHVPMVEVKTLGDTSFNFVSADRGTWTLKNLDDYVTNNESQKEQADIDAPIVFVGYGINAPEYAWDDYKGVDLKGKVALLFVEETILKHPKCFNRKGRASYWARA